MSVDSGTAITISQAATGTTVGLALTFSIDSDNLIKHPYAFEPITAEQFELGGSNAHEDWNWFNDYTIKKVRTGGWASKNTASTTLAEYAGIITLGSLDVDTQVYYQQSNSEATPTDFTFLGPVNEAILTYELSPALDYRTYLKLFARKKGKTYDQSEIADIGVTTIQSIVNRFPLAHADDSAITATDAEVLSTDGTVNFREQQATALETGSDGAKTANLFIFTSAGSTFQTNGVAAGDTLYISSGAEIGYYTIDSVDSETQLTIAQDFEFTSSGWGSTEGSLSFSVYTTYYFLDASTTRTQTDGALADVSTVTGTLTSATSLFSTNSVQAGDYVIIKDTVVTDYNGVYQIISVDSDTQLTLDTTDKTFASVSNIDFSVVLPGMYLQYKNDPVTSQTYDSYDTTNNDSSASMYSGVLEGVGQSFTGTGGTLLYATFGLAKTGSPTGYAYAKVYSHSGTYGTSSVPGTLLATSEPYEVSQLTGSEADIQFLFDGADNITLVNGTDYVVTVEFAGGSVSDTVDVGYDASSPAHGGNYSDYDGATWTANSANDVGFFVSIAEASVGNLTFADANPDTIARSSGDWTADGVAAGDIITISGSTSNDGSYTIVSATSSTLTLVATDTLTAEGPSGSIGAIVRRPFKRTISSVVYGFHWRLFSAGNLALDCYQFVQHQLRQPTDINYGPLVNRGDITDLLMAYATPTGTTFDMIIDDINADDLNNVTFEDATGTSRLYPYVSSVTLSFNTNLQNDTNAKYWVFFTNDDAGDNNGYDYGTKNAIIVQDGDTNEVTGSVGGSPTYQFTYDYDGNVQRGGASASTDAPVTVVAIGLDTAQFVLTTGTITRSKGIAISLVSALERNYLNP